MLPLQQTQFSAALAGLNAEPRARPSPALLGVTFLTWSVRFSATVNLIASTLPHQPQIVYWLADWVPFEISAGRRILMFITALLLFVLSSGLERGKKAAWLLTLVALTVAPFIHLGRMIIWPQVILNLPLIILLYTHRVYFVARSDPRMIRSTLIVCPILLAALLIFGTVRLHQLVDETDGPDSWGGCLQAACELVLVQNAHTQHAQTERTLVLFSILRIGGTSIALLTLYLALRPNWLIHAGAHEREEKALRLIEPYGDDPMTPYAFLADKSFFISSTGRAAISYVVSDRFAVTLADPVGPPEALRRAITEFSEFCRHQGWVPIFYQATNSLLPIYRDYGFSAFQIGEDARLDASRFDLRGKDFQNLRTLCNKARKERIHFRWYDESSPRDEELERQLGDISKRWLARKKRIEMTFDMGAFSPEDLRRSGTGIALDPRGAPIAFVTWRPYAQGKGRALDLMRSMPEARNIIDFILVESICHFRSKGIHNLSLGNAPLAHAGKEYVPTSVEDRLVRFIYENLNQIYAYKPLFEFKRKYRPKWQPRFLAYPAGESLPLIGLALVRIHFSRNRSKF